MTHPADIVYKVKFEHKTLDARIYALSERICWIKYCRSHGALIWPPTKESFREAYDIAKQYLEEPNGVPVDSFIEQFITI